MMLDVFLMCVSFGLLAVIWTSWHEADTLRLRANTEEERADAAAGDAALWKVRFEQHLSWVHKLNEMRLAEVRANVAMEAKLRDEIERQHELRDEQTDRVSTCEQHIAWLAGCANANAANCEKRLDGLRKALRRLPVPSKSVQREIDRLLEP